MKLQSEMDNLDPDNDDRVHLKDLCATSKSLFVSLLATNGLSNTPETSFSTQGHHLSKYSDYRSGP